MRVVVFGATGAIGRHVVDEALGAGHQVVAFTRDPSRLTDVAARLTVVQGDAEDAAAVDGAIAGADAVVNALGPTTNRPEEIARSERIIRNVIDAMQRHGATRIVTLSGAAVTAAGERKPLAGRLVSAFVRMAVRNVVAAKQREYELVAESGLEWTAVRPPRVTDVPASGHYAAGPQLGGRSISRGDLARFMVEQLADRAFVRQAPYVSG